MTDISSSVNLRSLDIAGQRPTDKNWYNIAIRWVMPSYGNATNFQMEKMNNVKTKDFGGLEVLIKQPSITGFTKWNLSCE